jgi:hypothetical protein
MKAIIICGSRHWKDVDSIREVLCGLPKDTVVIHGGQRSKAAWRPCCGAEPDYGADHIAAKVAKSIGMNVVAMHAQWECLGRRAGPVRNGTMLQVLRILETCGYEIAVHAFPMSGSRGTRNMMRLAEKACVKVYEHGGGS